MLKTLRTLSRRPITSQLTLKMSPPYQAKPAHAAFSIANANANASATRGPPTPPEAEATALREGNVPTYLGTTKRLPEFNLVDKVVLVSGAARGLGLVQAEALLEAGATGEFTFTENHLR